MGGLGEPGGRGELRDAVLNLSSSRERREDRGTTPRCRGWKRERGTPRELSTPRCCRPLAALLQRLPDALRKDTALPGLHAPGGGGGWNTQPRQPPFNREVKHINVLTVGHKTSNILDRTNTLRYLMGILTRTAPRRPCITAALGLRRLIDSKSTYALSHSGTRV